MNARKGMKLRMIQHKEHFHGSDLEKIEKVYGIRRAEIVSFSANVNPLGICPRMKEALSSHLDVVTSYPDREYTALRQAIASYCGTDASYVMVGNGSTELISLFIKSRHPRQALILAPTYSEYEREIGLSGGTCHYFTLHADNGFALNIDALKEELTAKQIDLLILCNPNNPTSTALTKEVMEQILTYAQSHNIGVIVDETYCEFTPDVETYSAISLVPSYSCLVVLRGVSKFFASPGLRLGYAVTSDERLLSYIREHKDPWTINSLADLAGQVMFTDTEYIHAVRSLIQTERTRVCKRLRAIPGLTVFEPYANFVLLRIDRPDRNAAQLFDAAIRQKMMIRDCSTFPGLTEQYFRLCFMLPEDNDRLLTLIEEFFA